LPSPSWARWHRHGGHRRRCCCCCTSNSMYLKQHSTRIMFDIADDVFHKHHLYHSYMKILGSWKHCIRIVNWQGK
jgi:hypothetical protein